MEVASDHDTRERTERFHFEFDARSSAEVKEVEEAEEINEQRKKHSGNLWLGVEWAQRGRPGGARRRGKTESE
jgi:hypothetical protein